MKSKFVLLNRAPGAHTVFYLCLFSTGLMVYLAGSSISSYVCPEKYQATIETRPDWRRKVVVEQVSQNSEPRSELPKLIELIHYP